MTATLERQQEADIRVLPDMDVLAAINARLAKIHSEPMGRHELIVCSLMLGSAATRPEIQV